MENQPAQVPNIQELRFSENEKELFRRSFKGRDDILTAIRNLFFGFELTKTQEDLITSIRTHEIMSLLKKTFIPELRPDDPIDQGMDWWMTIQISTLQEYDVMVKAWDNLLDKLGSALALLEDLTLPRISLRVVADTITPDRQSNLIARNSYISHIKRQLIIIRALADSPEETEKQRKERLKKDSTR